MNKKQKQEEYREEVKQANRDYFKEKDAEWRQYRAEQQTHSIDERARDLSWFQLVVQSVMKTTPEETPDEARAEAIKVQRDFFTANPFRLLCDPKLFRHIFPKGSQMDMLLFPVIKAALVKDIGYARVEESFAKSYEDIQ